MLLAENGTADGERLRCWRDCMTGAGTVQSAPWMAKEDWREAGCL